MAEPAAGIVERELRALGGELAFPETPPLAASVTSRLLSERVASRTPRPFPGVALWTRRRTLALAVAGLLLVGGAAVAGRLAIGAVGVRIVQRSPSVEPSTNEAAFGRPVSLAEATDLLGFVPAYPARLGVPDDVRIAQAWSGTHVVVLAWRPAPGEDRPIPGLPWSTLLMQLPGEDELAIKEVLGGGAVEPAKVNRSEALWIAGAHDLILRTPEGERRFLVVSNTLVWQHDGITYRLETGLSKPDARALAETMP